MKTKTKPLWYAVAVEEKHAGRIAAELRRKAKADYEIGRRIKRVLNPTTVEKRVVNGKLKAVSTPKFPGYLILRLDFAPELVDLIHEVRGVFSLLPEHNPVKPTALKSQEEVELLLSQKNNTIQRQDVRSFDPPPLGTSVRVVAGVFADLVGVVKGLNPAAETIGVEVKVLGVPTTINLKKWEYKRVV